MGYLLALIGATGSVIGGTALAGVAGATYIATEPLAWNAVPQEVRDALNAAGLSGPQ